MDVALLGRIHHVIKTVQDRMAKLPRPHFKVRAPAVLGSILTKYKFAGLFALALLMGWVADQNTRKWAIARAMTSLNPPESLWIHALGSRQFLKVQEPEVLRRIDPPETSMGEHPDQVWLSADGAWVRLAHVEDPALATYFTSDRAIVSLSSKRWKPEQKKRLPTQWKGFGSGVTAYEELLALLDSAPAAQNTPLARKSTPQSDGREIRY